MNKLKKKIIKTVTQDDAKWDKCFVDFQSAGIRTNTTFTAYDPPKDPKDKSEYDQHWEAVKRRAV